MTKYRYVSMSVLTVTFLLMYSAETTQAKEPNWPQFRGPDGLGIAQDDERYPREKKILLIYLILK